MATMPHIHTEPGQHDPTVSAYIVRVDTDEPRLLLHMHKKLKKLMQPGGHVELRETPWQAILHELTEETGYQPAQLQVLQPENSIKVLTNAVVHPVPVCQITHLFAASEYEHYHTDTSYAMLAQEGPSGDVGAGESQDIRFLSLNEISNLSDNDIYPNVKQIALHVLTVCLADWKAVDLNNFKS